MDSILTDLMATVSALAYLFYVWSETRRDFDDLQNSNTIASSMLVVGFLLHTMYALLILGIPGSIQFSLGGVCAFIALGAVGCTLYLYFANGYRVIALVVVPITILVLVPTMFLGTGEKLPPPSGVVITHVFISLIAYATLVVTAIQAISILLLDRSLKQHDSTALVKLMPPLETIEDNAMYMLRFGATALTLSVATGLFMLWQEIQMGRYWTHLGLAVACWVIYVALVVGQLVFGWRGQTSAKLSLSAFLVLLAGFLGLSVAFGYAT